MLKGTIRCDHNKATPENISYISTSEPLVYSNNELEPQATKSRTEQQETTFRKCSFMHNFCTAYGQEKNKILTDKISVHQNHPAQSGLLLVEILLNASLRSSLSHHRLL